MKNGTHTLVIGGGIVGLSAAYFLARRGERVSVVERDALAQGASSGNAGILALGHAPLPRPGLMGQMLRLLLRRTNPVYVAPRLDPSLLRWLYEFRRACAPDHFDRSMELLANLGWSAGECVRDLIEGEGIDCEYHRTGWLEVFRTNEGLAEGSEIIDQLGPFGYTVKVLSGDELREREPAFRDEVVGALHYVDSAFANPAKLVTGLASRAAAHGAELRFETEVDRIYLADGKFAGVSLADGNRIEADRVVLAAGVWSTELARRVGIRVPMQAGKGYHLNLDGVPRLPSTTCVLAERFVAVTPLDGGLRLAGTVELAGVNLRKTQRRMDMLPVGARAYIRGIDEARIETTWCGLRPMTADGLPAVGWAPGVAGSVHRDGSRHDGFPPRPAVGAAGQRGAARRQDVDRHLRPRSSAVLREMGNVPISQNRWGWWCVSPRRRRESMTHPPKRIYRSRTDRQIAGICGGIGRYSDLDPVLVRLIVVAVTCLTGIVPGIVAYLFGWIIVPDEPLPAPAAHRPPVEQPQGGGAQ